MSSEGGKTLNARQSAACENAKSPRSACRCRCGGVCHGIARGPVRDLPIGDPHRPDDESPKERRAREAAEKQKAFMDRILGSMNEDKKFQE